jgi:hypothetical protein
MQPNPYQTPPAEDHASPNVATKLERSPPVAFMASLVIVIIGTLMVCGRANGFLGGLFFLPFLFGPLMLAWIPMWICRSERSQGVFLLANLAYAIWFLYVYLDVFHFHPDANSVIGLLFVGLYSLPILLCLCVIAIAIHLGQKQA